MLQSDISYICVWVCVCVTGGLFSSDSFLGGGRREKHYHKDYRTPKDEIRDYMGSSDTLRCVGDSGSAGINSALLNSGSEHISTFSSSSGDNQYNRQYNQYLNRIERTYSQQVQRETFCDNRATDSRSYTERRKKTVRFNSEGWDTPEDENLDQSCVDPKWSSSQSVYYDPDRSPSGRASVGTTLSPFPREPAHGLVRAAGCSVPHHIPSSSTCRRGIIGQASLSSSWTTPVRELPLPLAPFGNVLGAMGMRKEPWEVERQESQDSQTKDSGIDSGTSSNFNSSEDSSKGDIPRSCRVCAFNGYLQDMYIVMKR